MSYYICVANLCSQHISCAFYSLVDGNKERWIDFRVARWHQNPRYIPKSTSPYEVLSSKTQKVGLLELRP